MRPVIQAVGRLLGLTVEDAAVKGARVKNPKLRRQGEAANRSFSDVAAGQHRPPPGVVNLGGAPDLIVTLGSATLRSQLLERLRQRNGLQSNDLGLDGVFQVPVKLGLFDVLVGEKFALFRNVRARAKELGYLATWHSGGNIFVRKSQGTRAHIVHSLVDLENLRN